MRIKSLALLVSPLLLGAAAVPAFRAAMPQTQANFELIPPDPAEIYETLSENKISIVKAIEIAEGSVQTGKAGRAMYLAPGGRPHYLVDVMTPELLMEVTVDVKEGKILSKVAKPRFPGERVTGKWTETGSGLKFYDIVKGTGAQPAGPSTKVTVHYTGWLVTGKKFDSSVDRGQPASFRLNEVISGWTEGVGSMKVGGKRKLIIPYSLGYGERGGRGIPPRATLIFDVELIEVQ